MFAEIVVLLLFIVTLLWFPYYAWRDGDLRPITGPIALPFIGTLHSFLNTPKIFDKLKENLYKYGGKSFRGYLLTEQSIFTIDKALIELTTTHTAAVNKSRVYNYLHNWLGTGLLTSSDNKWRQRRKMITPAYHFQVLDQFLEIFDRNSNIMIEKMHQDIGSAQMDIFPYINLCALDTICETSMGTQVNAQTSRESDFVCSTKTMNRIIMARAFSLVKTFDTTYPLTEDYRLEKRALEILHSYTLSVIKSRRTELLKQRDDCTEQRQKRKDNFLDLLLKSTIDGAPLSDEDIREEVDTFTFEGHDTVSSGMSFALYAISNHPEVQRRLIDEQQAIYGDNPKRATTLRDLADMKYLDMVIKESMRLYPPVPVFGRALLEDLEFNNLKLRKGLQIVMFIYELHRDADNFPDPLRFDPERFSTENQLGRHPFAYLPFSAGHRNCIGQKFAMLEMKSTIAKVLRNYELLPLVPMHEPDILPETVLRSSNGLLMRIHNRNWGSV